jgi:hypothetical protein
MKSPSSIECYSSSSSRFPLFLLLLHHLEHVLDDCLATCLDLVFLFILDDPFAVAISFLMRRFSFDRFCSSTIRRLARRESSNCLQKARPSREKETLLPVVEDQARQVLGDLCLTRGEQALREGDVLDPEGGGVLRLFPALARAAG